MYTTLYIYTAYNRNKQASKKANKATNQQAKQTKKQTNKETCLSGMRPSNPMAPFFGIFLSTAQPEVVARSLEIVQSFAPATWRRLDSWDGKPPGMLAILIPRGWFIVDTKPVAIYVFFWEVWI